MGFVVGIQAVVILRVVEEVVRGIVAAEEEGDKAVARFGRVGLALCLVDDRCGRREGQVLEARERRVEIVGQAYCRESPALMIITLLGCAVRVFLSASTVIWSDLYQSP